jgi:hypothetical protein
MSSNAFTPELTIVFSARHKTLKPIRISDVGFAETTHNPFSHFREM